jgi:polyhydroxybutyrate depolymerase
MQCGTRVVNRGAASVDVALGRGAPPVPVASFAELVRARALLVLLLSTGCLATCAAPAAASPCGSGERAGRFSLRLESGGIARYALVNVPPEVPSTRPLPVVLALHGAGGTGRRFEVETGLSSLADSRGFVVVYASAAWKTWNITASPNKPDDVAFIRQLLDTVESQVCVSTDRVYATGVSNGGGMTALLGCAMSDRLAGIAPVAGNYAPLPACAPDRPVSMLEIHGTADRSVPYRVVPGWIGTWLRLDGCLLDMRTSRPSPAAMRYDAGPCAQGSRVSHLELFGGVHEWPAAADAAVWQFFAPLRLARAAATADPSP